MTNGAPRRTRSICDTSEERFRLLVESVRDYAIFMLDPDGRVLTWNAGAERIKGYRADEIIGQHFSRFYPPEALARGLPEHELEVATRSRLVRGRGLARPEGRLAVLGQRRHHRDPRRRRRAARLRQGHARPDPATRTTRRRCARAKSGFGCWSKGVADYAIFMLDVNGRRRHLERRRATDQGLLGRRDHRPATSRSSIPPDASDSGWPDYELKVAAEKGSFVDNGWRVRKDGTHVLGQRHHHGAARRRRASRRLRQAHPRPDREQAGRGGRARRASNATRSWRPSAAPGWRRSARRASRTSSWRRCRTSCARRSARSWAGRRCCSKAGTEIEPARQRRAIEVIDRNARAQVQLIDDLLDLSRIMTGKIRLDLQQVSLQTVVEAAVDSAQARGGRQGHSPEGHPGSGPARPSTPTRPGCSRWCGTC